MQALSELQRWLVPQLQPQDSFVSRGLKHLQKSPPNEFLKVTQSQ